MVAPIVVFDLDGTVVDTAPDLVGTLNIIFARMGLPAVPYSAARNMVGGGARAMIERGLAAEGRTVSAAELERLVGDFIEHYAEHIADGSRPFPGLAAALDELAAGGGCRAAICTNKLEWLARRLLAALGLANRFVAICGGDTFGLQKPDPDFLRRTIGRAEGSNQRAVMVGDSISDTAMARAAGIPVIAVNYGYSEKPMAELGADRVISGLFELPGAVFELLSLRRASARQKGCSGTSPDH